MRLSGQVTRQRVYETVRRILHFCSRKKPVPESPVSIDRPEPTERASGANIPRSSTIVLPQAPIDTRSPQQQLWDSIERGVPLHIDERLLPSGRADNWPPWMPKPTKPQPDVKKNK